MVMGYATNNMICLPCWAHTGLEGWHHRGSLWSQSPQGVVRVETRLGSGKLKI